MKNETISRVILVLEIGVIILFHALKSNPSLTGEVVKRLEKGDTMNKQAPAHFVQHTTSVFYK